MSNSDVCTAYLTGICPQIKFITCDAIASEGYQQSKQNCFIMSYMQCKINVVVHFIGKQRTFVSLTICSYVE